VALLLPLETPLLAKVVLPLPLALPKLVPGHSRLVGIDEEVQTVLHGDVSCEVGSLRVLQVTDGKHKIRGSCPLAGFPGKVSCRP